MSLQVKACELFSLAVFLIKDEDGEATPSLTPHQVLPLEGHIPTSNPPHSILSIYVEQSNFVAVWPVDVWVDDVNARRPWLV